MTVHPGATLERFPGSKYFAGLDFFEFAPRAPLPRAATLTRFRHQAPEGVLAALRAPQSALVSAAGPLQPSEQQAEQLAWTLDAADKLQAALVVFVTPASLTPGQRSRTLLQRFADALPRPAGRRYVWAPRGLWEEEDSAALATELGLVRAFDPIHEQRPPGPVVYARLQAMGAQTSFSDALLSDVLERVHAEPFEQAFVSIDSDRSVQQAQRMRALLAEREGA